MANILANHIINDIVKHIAYILANNITNEIAKDIANILANSMTNEIADKNDLFTNNFDSDMFNNFVRHLTISIHR